MNKNTSRKNIVDAILDEYVVWGGPTVTRREALADCQDKGLSAKAIDVLVFGRKSVPAPVDPAGEVMFLRQIQALGW